jgi:hypothetical protein
MKEHGSNEIRCHPRPAGFDNLFDDHAESSSDGAIEKPSRNCKSADSLKISGQNQRIPICGEKYAMSRYTPEARGIFICDFSSKSRPP